MIARLRWRHGDGDGGMMLWKTRCGVVAKALPQCDVDDVVAMAS